MARILVIDNETKTTEEIKKTFLDLDAQSAVEVYPTLESFETFIRTAAPDYFQFDLVILEYQLAKPTEWDAKIKDFKSKLPPGALICLTTYDAPTVLRKNILGLEIFNFLYKPYDPLILKETLNMALKIGAKPGEALKPIEMKPQPSTAFVGILKDVDIISISEVGFVTHNDSAIALNSFSKYYNRLFSHGKKQSVWAQCIQSQENPNQPGVFISRFHFVGIESPVLMKLRAHLQTNKQHKTKNQPWPLDDAPQTRPLSIAVLVTQETELKLKEDIESHFKNVTVDLLPFDPEKKAEPYTTAYDAVINLNPAVPHEAFASMFKPTAVHILLCEEVVTDDQFKERLPLYRDIFRLPLDRSYFYKKLKILLPELQFVDQLDVFSISSSEKLKATSLVKLSEICELYLVFTYHRELPRNSFREFAFIPEDENQMIQMPAFCIFSQKGAAEPGNSNPSYTHQFIFWGTTDHYLKQIRIWLLHNYIEKNQDNSA